MFRQCCCCRVALIVHYRGVQQERVWLVIAGAALLGLGVNLRETMGFYAPWLIVAPFVCGWKFQPTRDSHSRDFVSGIFSAARSAGLHFGLLLTRTIAGFGLAGANRCCRKAARHPVTLHSLRPYLGISSSARRSFSCRFHLPYGS